MLAARCEAEGLRAEPDIVLMAVRQDRFFGPWGYVIWHS